MKPRFQAILSALLFASLSISARAQAEPQLVTQTDLTDVYRKDQARSQMVTVLDFTTGSRGVYEAAPYVTFNGRDEWIGQLKGLPTTSVTLGKDYGYVFALKNGTNQVYLLRWPRSADFYSEGGIAVVGTPYNFKNTFNGSVVNAVAGNDVATIQQITHVRFTLTNSAGVARTIDLPCPTALFDSPYPQDSNSPTKPAYSTVANYSKHAAGGTSIVYDPWSDAHPTLTDPSGTSSFTPPAGYTVIGNFYYSLDYLSFIYASKSVRQDSGAITTTVAAPTSGNYASSSGYAIPSITDTTTIPGVGAVSGAVGWYNGLPVMTRYQAQKSAAINVLIRHDGLLNWVYRYLDGYIDNSGSSEEGGGAFSSAGPGTANPAQSVIWNDNSIANRKFLRRLDVNGTYGLVTGNTSLQQQGPSGWFQAYKNNPSGYDTMNVVSATGNTVNIGIVDPRTPQPWAYALANTYWRTNIEPVSTANAAGIFDAQGSSACPGKTYVVAFPTMGLTDSYTQSTTNIPQDAAASYVSYTTTGNSGLNKGGTNAYLLGSPWTSLAPTTSTFHPAVLADSGAFGTGTNNAGDWGAGWEVNPSKARSSSNPGIQTMVVSIGIPGVLNDGSSHNQRSYQAEFFKIAQWADPYRTDLGYGGWQATKGNFANLDAPVTGGGKVRYYESGNPSALETNLDNLVEYIVKGSAALSAPATPSTGARTTTQAYFGIFNTTRTPIWNGNLFSVGIKRSVVSTVDCNNNTVQHEVLTFYGAQGEDTRTPIIDPVTGAVTGYGISDFPNHHLWSAYDIFGVYRASDVSASGNPQPVPGDVIGSPLLWSSRKVFSLDPTTPQSGPLIDFSSSNSGLVTKLVAQFTAAGLFPAFSGDTATNTARVQDFIDFVRGKNLTDTTGTTNRIDIMGDILDSAPLAVELSLETTSPSIVPSSLSSQLSTLPTENQHLRLILVGDNEGLLHCFGEAAGTDPNTGLVTAKATELWSFVPPDFLNLMFKAYSVIASNPASPPTDSMTHPYMVDGDPSLFWQDLPHAPNQLTGDGRVSTGEDAVAIFGMRKGARSYYALGLSLIADSTATVMTPKLLWTIRPDLSTDPVIQKMGMSTAAPAYATVQNGSSSATPAVFLSGGYSNDQVNAQFSALNLAKYGAGLGKSVVAILSPQTTTPTFKTWDFSTDTSIGAIAGGVAPVLMNSASPLAQRIYFADFRGNVMALNMKGPYPGIAGGFRNDSADITSWISSPRFIYKAINDGFGKPDGSNPLIRFTNRPDAFRLSGGFPAYVTVNTTDSSNTPITTTLRPVTVMVSIGSGDRNNPTDAAEVYTTPATGIAVQNRMMVFADRQDSGATWLNYDILGMSGSALQAINDPGGVTDWATTYSDVRVTPGATQFFWNTKNGYYFNLRPAANQLKGHSVYDKVLVAPLTKQASLFFSLFDVNSNGGFDCSANAFTRTFRECDITRPLGVNTQLQPGTNPCTNGTVGDTNQLNRGLDSCNGLAFYFNSLSSQLVDAGDQVVQGGAVTAAGTPDFNTQKGANSPDIKTIKDTDDKHGFKLRNWRVVR